MWLIYHLSIKPIQPESIILLKVDKFVISNVLVIV